MGYLPQLTHGYRKLEWLTEARPAAALPTPAALDRAHLDNTLFCDDLRGKNGWRGWSLRR